MYIEVNRLLLLNTEQMDLHMSNIPKGDKL